MRLRMFRQMSIVVVLLGLVSLGCKEQAKELPSKGNQAVEQAVGLPAEPAAEESAVKDETGTVKQTEPAKPASPPPLSRPEALLQDIAGSPEPYMGAVELNTACAANTAARDKKLREEQIPKFRLQQQDQDTIVGWQGPIGKMLAEQQWRELARLQVLLNIEAQACRARGLNNQPVPTGEPEARCIAMALQDPSKCDPKCDFGMCLIGAKLRTYSEIFSKWDAKAPALDQCGQEPLAAAFFGKEMCALAIKEGCVEMGRIWRANICNTLTNQSPPVDCSDPKSASFWCRLLRAGKPGGEQTTCVALVNSGEAAFPENTCHFVPASNILRKCSAEEEASLEVPIELYLACGILEYSLGIQRACGKGATPDEDLVCRGRVLGAFYRDKTPMPCEVLDERAGAFCQAISTQSPDKCPLTEPMHSEPPQEVIDACRKPYIQAVQAQIEGAPGPVYLDVLAPLGLTGECELVVSAPSADGTPWKFPLQVKASGDKLTRVELPKTVTSAIGVKVEPTCKWTAIPAKPDYVPGATPPDAPRPTPVVQPVIIKGPPPPGVQARQLEGVPTGQAPAPAPVAPSTPTPAPAPVAPVTPPAAPAPSAP